MRILHLILKKKWFDMISSGEKTEEYREIKPYWAKRLLSYHDGWDSKGNLKSGRVEFQPYQWVSFRNGYNENSPKQIRWITETLIDEGKPEWGAEPGKKILCYKTRSKTRLTTMSKEIRETIRQYSKSVEDELRERSKREVYAFDKDYFDGAHALFIILRNKGLLKDSDSKQ